MPTILISSLVILVYIIYIIWTWHNLGFLEKNKKIAFIVIGTLIILLITFIIFNISKQEIVYPNENIEASISNILILIFTGLNSIILMPVIAKFVDKLNEDEIQKEKFLKILIIILVIFIIIAILECGYIKDTIEGILSIYKSLAI